MICLDTNYLILALVPDSSEANRVIQWSKTEQRLVVPSVVWYEFISGPITTRQSTSVRSIIQEVIPFEEYQAELAAKLWNETNRRRAMRINAMIAATAIHLNAPLATNNFRDFEPFTELGLELLP